MMKQTMWRCSVLITLLASSTLARTTSGSHGADEMVLMPMTAQQVPKRSSVGVDSDADSVARVTPTTTAIITSCTTESDCSYNGVCVNKMCVCDAAWEGAQCGTLRLLPTARSSGLRAVDNGRNTSTWGGTVSECECA